VHVFRWDFFLESDSVCVFASFPLPAPAVLLSRVYVSFPSFFTEVLYNGGTKRRNEKTFSNTSEFLFMVFNRSELKITVSFYCLFSPKIQSDWVEFTDSEPPDRHLTFYL
jgi:hypothetical protein